MLQLCDAGAAEHASGPHRGRARVRGRAGAGAAGRRARRGVAGRDGRGARRGQPAASTASAAGSSPTSWIAASSESGWSPRVQQAAAPDARARGPLLRRAQDDDRRGVVAVHEVGDRPGRPPPHRGASPRGRRRGAPLRSAAGGGRSRRRRRPRGSVVPRGTARGRDRGRGGRWRAGRACRPPSDRDARGEHRRFIIARAGRATPRACDVSRPRQRS